MKNKQLITIIMVAGSSFWRRWKICNNEEKEEENMCNNVSGLVLIIINM